MSMEWRFIAIMKPNELELKITNMPGEQTRCSPLACDHPDKFNWTIKHKMAVMICAEPIVGC